MSYFTYIFYIIHILVFHTIIWNKLRLIWNDSGFFYNRLLAKFCQQQFDWWTWISTGCSQILTRLYRVYIRTVLKQIVVNRYREMFSRIHHRFDIQIIWAELHLMHFTTTHVYLRHWLKTGNVLFNDALNTFYLRLYGVGHMVKDHSDRHATTWATRFD